MHTRLLLSLYTEDQTSTSITAARRNMKMTNTLCAKAFRVVMKYSGVNERGRLYGVVNVWASRGNLLSLRSDIDASTVHLAVEPNDYCFYVLSHSPILNACHP